MRLKSPHFGTVLAHFVAVSALSTIRTYVRYIERGRSIRRVSSAGQRVGASSRQLRADEARKERRKAQIVREAEDDGDWRDAGWCLECAVVHAALRLRLPQRAAHRARQRSAAQPASTRARARAAGELTLDQTIADGRGRNARERRRAGARRARQSPREIERIAPPRSCRRLVADDQALYPAARVAHDLDWWWA